MEIEDFTAYETDSEDSFSDKASFLSGSVFAEYDEEVLSMPSNNQSYFEQLEKEDSYIVLDAYINNSIEYKRKAIQNFNSVINIRKDYLDSLNGLDNWISGDSEAPSKGAIEDSKFILDSFKNWLSAKIDYPLPKVIMGPIPVGGITLELRPNNHNAMFITVLNNSEIEIEVMQDDYFYSVDKTRLQAKPYLLETYENIIDG